MAETGVVSSVIRKSLAPSVLPRAMTLHVYAWLSGTTLVSRAMQRGSAIPLLQGSNFSLSLFLFELRFSCPSLVAQLIKNLPAVQEMQVRSLGWEDPVEKEMATHSSILTWKISWTEEPGGLQSTGLQRVGHDWVTNT